MDHPTLDETRTLAQAVLRGHTDYRGFPIIDHVGRVVRSAGNSPHATTEVLHAAWLHDVVEDTGLSQKDLETMGYSAAIREAVDLLTHDRRTHSYEMYLRRIIDSKNVMAITVKLADVQDNTDPERYDGMPQERADFLRRRYDGVMERLQRGLELVGAA